MIEREIHFTASKRKKEVSAVLLRPKTAHRLLVFAHGAGAGMRHAFMENTARKLAEHEIATFRYNFPYTEAGRKAPDPQPVLLDTVHAAVDTARLLAGDLPLLAGGKSLGGRMTSTTASHEILPGVQGLVFFGFPLHAPGKPSDERGKHLFQVNIPMLFLQGTRDNLADLNLLRPLCHRLQAHGKVMLHEIDGADHGFHVPRKSGRSDEDVLEELAAAVAQWNLQE
jgi:uncharacterized protein